jgi:hypothetical protein
MNEYANNYPFSYSDKVGLGSRSADNPGSSWVAPWANKLGLRQ